MRRQIVSFVFAGFVAVTVPVIVAPAVGEGPASSPAATVVVPRPSLQAPWVRDEAAMVLVGTVLIGLAVAMRRAA